MPVEDTATTAAPDNPGVIAPPPLLYAGALVLGLLIHVVLPVGVLPSGSVPAQTLAALLIVAAGLTAASAFAALARARTNVDPAKPTTVIVTNGPFRFTRNPIYLALTLLYAGIAALMNALWPLLLLAPLLVVMQQAVIGREERYLENKFGGAYLRYKARVRRWL